MLCRNRIVRRFFLLVVILTSSQAIADLNCNSGSDLIKTTSDLLGYQQGAEMLDDINVGLGIIPSGVIAENVRQLTESVDDTIGNVQELQTLCRAIASKDVVEQYFYAVDKLFGSSAMAPWVSMNVEMARAIVSNANTIASNRVENAIQHNAAIGVHFTIELSQYRSWLWNRGITGSELVAGNHLRSGTIIIKDKVSNTIETTLPISPTFESKSPIAILLFEGGRITIDSGIDTNNKNIFIDLIWKNGQRSIIPVASDYYRAQGDRVIFSYVIKNGNYILTR